MPRYQARWSNGYWKTFDRVTFNDVATHGTKKLAEDATAEMNAAKRR